MRIWSISPKYLDTKGLVALWRESLLAKKVLKGETRGYRNHPQLNRFKNSKDPIILIDAYLGYIYEEAVNRDYSFDRDKFTQVESYDLIKVTKGQVIYELDHLRNKLIKRSPSDIDKLPKDISGVQLVPMFTMVDGEVEDWEVIK